MKRKSVILLSLGAGTVISGGVFMYLHNGEIKEAVALSLTIALGLLFLWFLTP